MKIIELSDRIVYCDDIIEIYVENNYSPTRYQLKTTNGTYRITREDYYKIREYLLSLNDEVKIVEEEKKIPEKLENEHEFYSYAEYEEKKNEIDKILYILKAINLVEEKIGNLNNSINEIIDYLNSKGE